MRPILQGKQRPRSSGKLPEVAALERAHPELQACAPCEPAPRGTCLSVCESGVHLCPRRAVLRCKIDLVVPRLCGRLCTPCFANTGVRWLSLALTPRAPCRPLRACRTRCDVWSSSESGLSLQRRARRAPEPGDAAAARAVRAAVSLEAPFPPASHDRRLLHAGFEREKETGRSLCGPRRASGGLDLEPKSGPRRRGPERLVRGVWCPCACENSGERW